MSRPRRLRSRILPRRGKRGLAFLLPLVLVLGFPPSRARAASPDDPGFTEAVKAGYDPRGLITFLRTVLARPREDPNAVAHLFATHPPCEERIQALSPRWWAARPRV